MSIKRDYYICPKCHNCGEIDISKPGFLIICNKCGHKDSYVKCNNCGVEGSFVKVLNDNNYEWTCDYCNNSNILKNDFYRNPIRIIYSKKLEKSKVWNDPRSQYKNNIVAYIVLYIIIIIGSLLGDENVLDVWRAIELLGMTSLLFIIGYFGLKMASLRFNTEDKIRIFIEQLHLTFRELSIHLGIVIVVFIILIPSSEDIPQSSINSEAFNSKLIIAIEETFDRADITKIVKVDDKYIITFSDNSIEVFEYNGE